MDEDAFIEKLLAIFPYWEYVVMRPLARHMRQTEGDLSVEEYFLLQIVRWYKTLTMTEVAQHLSTTKQQATLKVDRLCARGYLRRVQGPGDRRVIRVEATEQAVRETNACRAHMGVFADVLRQKLDDTDRETLHTAMDMMLSVLPKLA